MSRSSVFVPFGYRESVGKLNRMENSKTSYFHAYFLFNLLVSED